MTNKVYPQLSVRGYIDINTLTKNILPWKGIKPFNVKYKGYKKDTVNTAIGYFDGSKSNVGLKEGILLTTGIIGGAVGPNNTLFKSEKNGVQGDSDLDVINKNNNNVLSYDAAVLEFDFMAGSEKLEFNYVFASEEYPDFYEYSLKDLFAIILSGPGIINDAGLYGKNIALLPKTNQIVNVNNLFSKDTSLFVNNLNGKTIQYNGFSKVLTASANVIPCNIYHVKIAIADFMDNEGDSGAFIEASNVKDGEVYTSATNTNSEAGNNIVKDCNNAIISFKLDKKTLTNKIVKFKLGGTAKIGVDYTIFPVICNDSIVIYAGSDSVSIKLISNTDSVGVSSKKIEFKLVNTYCGENFYSDSLSFNIKDDKNPIINKATDIKINAGDSITIKPDIISGVDPYTYNWNTGETNQSIVVSPIQNTTYKITIKDACKNSIVDSISIIIRDSTGLEPKILVTPMMLDLYNGGKSLENSQQVGKMGVKIDTSLGISVGVMVDTMKLYNLRMNHKPYKFASSLDWSIYDESARDQKQCGSCWDFSGTALIENIARQMSGKNGIPSGNIDLSEQTVMSCNPVNKGCNGGWPMIVYNYAKKNGIPNEDCYRYQAKDRYNGMDCNEKCSGPEYNIKVAEVEDDMWTENMTVDDLRDILQSGPVTVAMYVPDDFFNYTGGIYKYTGGYYQFGHAVLLVGYDDNQKCFKARNSWGTGWGEKGYFRISYDDVSSPVKFGCYTERASGAYEDVKPTVTNINIKNTGKSDLIVSSIAADKTWLHASTNSMTLVPSASKDITLSINWSMISNYKDTSFLSIKSNDIYNRIIKVRIIAHKDLSKETAMLSTKAPFYQDRLLSTDSSGLNIDIMNLGENILSYSISSDVDWLQIDKPLGSGDNSIEVMIKKNPSNVQRTGIITIDAAGVAGSPKKIVIKQGTNHSPKVSDINKMLIALKKAQPVLTFNKKDFTDFFSDADGDTLKMIRIEELPLRGTLMLDKSKVVPYEIIASEDIAKLTYVPDTDNVQVSLRYSGSDGKNMSSNQANVIIDIAMGIEILKSDDGFIISANNNILSVMVPEINVIKSCMYLYSIEGKLLMKSDINSKFSTYNIENMSSGVYLVKIVDKRGWGLTVKKIVKE